jgi:nucleoside-diphosphate-sugar epimerase
MTYQHRLLGAIGAISCVGAFGSQAHMLKVNGTANAVATAAAKAAGIHRYVYISATIPPVPGIDYILDGYVKGKHMAEEVVRTEYPDDGVILRPYFIYGDRAVSTHVSIPLGMFMKPFDALLEKLPNRRQLSQLPVVGAPLLKSTSVEAVARAAVAAATDDTIPGGVMDCWEIAERFDQ